MTENGNHGGSSYEETDSLALFIGQENHASDNTLYNPDTIFQVMELYFVLVSQELFISSFEPECIAKQLANHQRIFLHRVY